MKTFRLGSNPSGATNFNQKCNMSKGIYLNNGVYAYAMDIEKKMKRRKNAKIIEVFEDISEEELQNKVNHYNSIPKKNKEVVEEATTFKYHWKNKVTGSTLHSIYNDLRNVPDPENWEPLK